MHQKISQQDELIERMQKENKKLQTKNEELQNSQQQDHNKNGGDDGNNLNHDDIEQLKVQYDELQNSSFSLLFFIFFHLFVFQKVF